MPAKEDIATASHVKRVRLKINGEEVEAPAGQVLIKACHDRGIDVPFFCYHPGLKPEGNCRMCLVEVSNSRKPVPACTTPVAEGLEVKTHSPGARAARADVLEFMLANHPLDCPICDKSGECLLQDNSYDHGKDGSRMVEVKELKPTKELGSEIMLWGNRCIACTRCVRFTSDIAGTGELTMVQRGDRTVVDVFPRYPLQNPLSGNVVDLCPVGALISKDFLYEARVWYEKKTDSVCHECARGCNIEIQTLHNKIMRIVPRHNAAVNDYWICDHGRYTYKYVLGPDRWLDYRLGTSGVPGPREVAAQLAGGLSTVVSTHGPLALGGVASAFMTNEHLLLFRRLFEALGVPLDRLAARMRAHGEAQAFKGGFRISADRNPNRRGVDAVLGAGAFDARHDALLERARRGELHGLVLVGDLPAEPLSDAWIEALGAVEAAVVFLLEADPRLPEHVLLVPATAFSERQGSVINEDGRVQLVEPATALPRGIVQMDDLLQDVLAQLGGRTARVSPAGLFDELGAVVPELAGVERRDIGKGGRRLEELAAGGSAA